MKRLITALALYPVIAAANPFESQLTDLVTSDINQWAHSSEVISAIKAQNIKNTRISSTEIDQLDKQWRAEVDSGNTPFIDKVLGSPLSSYLSNIQDQSEGQYTEIFVMDNKGLNVGQSTITSDYWQGDESKWQETFQTGSKAIHISDVEEDESTQTYQVQVSYTISDPETGEPIGAVTVGVNVDAL